MAGINIRVSFEEYKNALIEKVICDLIIFLVMGLSYFDLIKPDTFIRIIDKYVIFSGLIKKKHIINIFIELIINYYDATIFLNFLTILLRENVSIEYLFNLYSFTKKKNLNYFKNKYKEEINFIQQIIRKIGNNEKSSKIKGQLYYNIGNLYRANEIGKAKRYYFLAAKYDKGYRKRAYFYRELASLFFFEKKYRKASILYKRSLSLQYNLETLVLYADTLYYSKQFKLAYKKFDEYLHSSKNPYPEFIIKFYLVQLILFIYENPDEDENKIMIKLIENDFYNSDIWLEQGFKFEKDKKLEKAFICFLIAAMNNFNNLIALIKAILGSIIRFKRFDWATYLIQFAYRHNGDAFLRETYNIGREFNNQNELDKFLKMIKEIVNQEKSYKKDEELILRHIDNNGEYFEF